MLCKSTQNAKPSDGRLTLTTALLPGPIYDDPNLPLSWLIGTQTNCKAIMAVTPFFAAIIAAAGVLAAIALMRSFRFACDGPQIPLR